MGSLRQLFSLSTALSVLGMVIGVASLVVSMAVFSGYNKTLEGTVQDAVGHVIVIKRGAADQPNLVQQLEADVPSLVAETPFLYAEAILAHQGKINGVLIEGVDEASVHKVLKLDNRLTSGEFKFHPDSDGLPKVVIGKGIADRFKLKVGDQLRIVVPLAGEYQTQNFRPKVGQFKVAGVINYGRYDFDSRYMVMALKDVQSFAEVGSRITGYRLLLNDPGKARKVAQLLIEKYSPNLWARDWMDVNPNLFEAALLEKQILFFVLMILVVAAAFNVTNTLFISVVQRYRDISVLKTLGATNKFVAMIFTAQGLIVGGLGALVGILVGLLLCEAFDWSQRRWQIIPADVYKLDHIQLQVQWLDLFFILGATLVVCFIATLDPARRGARISPI
jgi:lipoprotein-releasing system permease protein